MTVRAFIESTEKTQLPDGLSDYLKSLWYDKKGNWDKAHDIIQDVPDADGSWVHAYLHREEGDISNASYWYSRAGRALPGYELEEEWNRLVEYFVNR